MLFFFLYLLSLARRSHRSLWASVKSESQRWNAGKQNWESTCQNSQLFEGRYFICLEYEISNPALWEVCLYLDGCKLQICIHKLEFMLKICSVSLRCCILQRLGPKVNSGFILHLNPATHQLWWSCCGCIFFIIWQSLTDVLSVEPVLVSCMLPCWNPSRDNGFSFSCYILVLFLVTTEHTYNH